MKKYYTFILLLFFVCNSFAQKERDSLWTVWNNETLEDTTRLKALNVFTNKAFLKNQLDSAIYYAHVIHEFAQIRGLNKYGADAMDLIGAAYNLKGEQTSAVNYYQQAFELFEKAGNRKKSSRVLYDIGHIKWTEGKYAIAIDFYNRSIAIANEINDKERVVECLNGIAYSFFQQGQYTTATQHVQESLKLSEEIGYDQGIAWGTNALGVFYSRQDNLDKALAYYIKGMEINERVEDLRSLAFSLRNIGETYSKLNEPEKALDYIERSLVISEKVKNNRSVSFSLKAIGVILDKQGENEKAMEYYQRSLSISREIGNRDMECENLEDIGSLLLKQGDFLEGIEACQKSYEIALEIGSVEDQLNACDCLYNANKALRKYAIALALHEKMVTLNDSINIVSLANNLQQMEFTKQMFTDSLKYEEDKLKIELSHQVDLRKSERSKNVFIGIGVFILLIAIGIWSRMRFARKANERLKIEKDRAERSEQIKNSLFTNITHEFRTPLTVIKGMTDSIKSNLKNKQDNELENSLEMIERNSDNLLHLVNEMLDLSKIESGNMELQLVQSDVIPFLKYLSESFSSFAEENQINLTVYSEIDTLIMDFDANKLTSIVSNLLSNAIKFTPELGKIIIHINQVIQNETDYLYIKVKDNGIGIAEDELHNIFNRFYQTDASTVRENEGTGIGLALTKEIVELMQGTIEVQSTLDGGSEFLVQIPVTRKAIVSEHVSFTQVPRRSTLVAGAPQINPTQVIDSELPLVLIIEDNLDVAHYLKTCLSKNYETIHAINGIKGIELAIEKVPDIIISDVMMPGKDGFEVCETLKSDEHTDHIPIIILTAKASIEDRLKGLSHGADAYLAKPFNKEELFTRLDQLVLTRKKLINKIQKEGFNTLLKKRTKNPKLQFLQKVVKLIHEDIGDSNFGSESLAKKLLISESQVYRKIKAITGKSTAIYIRSIRLQYSKELLMSSEKTVSEVAFDVGFNDPSWFSRAFKDEFGFSPSSASK
jgi:signal transduction histidine kinase/CheY-like chemotaxis protein/AraC-like DNA-binding protein/Tfp pilus assembly protein PilF